MVALLISFGLAATIAPPVAAEESVAQQLAIHYVSQARQILDARELSPEMVDLALEMIQEAGRLDPNSADIQRLHIDVALLAERRDVKRDAVERLVRLDASDQRARLFRATMKIEEHQTLSGRVSAYESMLAPERRDRLGAAVASRLAYDLALLHRREGNTDRFAHWLTEAAVLDPTNKPAAALAAGYFRHYVEDAYAEAELLTNLLMADPTDSRSQMLLASHLLDHGAYRGAERIYRIARSTYESQDRITPDDLVADIALASWAAGNLSSALRLIEEHQTLRNQEMRSQLRRADPTLNPVERAQRVAALSPTLAAVRAAAALRAEDQRYETYVNRILDSTRYVLQQMEGALEENEQFASEINLERARLKLNTAWILLWLGGNVDRAEELLETTRALQPLSDRAEQRFRGWRAHREGRLADAVELLEPLREDDPASRLGLAEVYLDRGERQNAAREYLAVARAMPGSLMGVWANDRLNELLGQRAPLTAESTRMNDLIETLPRTLDRFVREPRSALSIRLTPVETRVHSYQPVRVRMEITNHAPFPLGIGRDEPIRSDVILLHNAQSVQAGVLGAMRPEVVSINRRLRLMPRERLTIDLDMRAGPLRSLLTYFPLAGVTVRTRGIVNFTTSPMGAPIPGVLGSDHETRPYRIDGQRITPDWIESSLARLEGDGPRGDLHGFARLCYAAASTLGPNAPEDAVRALTDTREAVRDAFPKLQPAEQAWIVCILPQGEGTEPILERARQSEDRDVIMSYLAFRVRHPDHPMLDRARRHDDAAVVRFSEVLYRVLRATFEEEIDPFFDMPEEVDSVIEGESESRRD